MLLPRDGPVRVRRQAGVVDGDDVGRGDEGVRDGQPVVRGFARPQVERLEAAVREPAVEGGGHGADGVLEEGEARVQAGGVEGGGAHEDVLGTEVASVRRCFAELRGESVWERGRLPSVR